MTILVLMIFSKYFFISCMTSYFTFFLIERFGVSVPDAHEYAEGEECGDNEP